jgi:hypothetical protein
MDDKEFKHKLTAVAEWHIPKTVDKSLDGKRGRGRPRFDDLESSDSVNNTLALQLIKIKTEPEVCGDCGRVCDQPRRLESKQFTEYGVKHWRTRCLICNHFQHPETLQFTVKPSTSTQYFKVFIKRKKDQEKIKNTVACRPDE